MNKIKNPKAYWDKVLRNLDSNQFHSRTDRASKKQTIMESEIVMVGSTTKVEGISRDAETGKRLTGDPLNQDLRVEILTDFYQGDEDIGSLP